MKTNNDVYLAVFRPLIYGVGDSMVIPWNVEFTVHWAVTEAVHHVAYQAVNVAVSDAVSSAPSHPLPNRRGRFADQSFLADLREST